MTCFGQIADAGPVKAHLKMLREEYGITWTAIALEVGVTPAAISYTWTTAKTLSKMNADAILAITPDLRFRAEADQNKHKANGFGPRVAKVGLIRRLRHLQRKGYPMEYISELAGFDVQQVVWGGRGWRTSLTRHQKIVALFDELWNTDGPSNRARVRAIRAGYAPASAYNDIDDPNEEPKGVVNPLPPVKPRSHGRPKGCRICGDQVKANGWCNKHYSRHRRHGDPNKVLKGGNRLGVRQR